MPASSSSERLKPAAGATRFKPDGVTGRGGRCRRQGCWAVWKNWCQSRLCHIASPLSRSTLDRSTRPTTRPNCYSLRMLVLPSWSPVSSPCELVTIYDRNLQRVHRRVGPVAKMLRLVLIGYASSTRRERDRSGQRASFGRSPAGTAVTNSFPGCYTEALETTVRGLQPNAKACHRCSLS
jgi:hypothetical protein